MSAGERYAWSLVACLGAVIAGAGIATPGFQWWCLGGSVVMGIGIFILVAFGGPA